MSAPRAWTPAQDAALRECAGRMPVSDVLVRVNAAGPARTRAGLLTHAATLGIPCAMPGRGGRRATGPRWQRSPWTGPEDALLRELLGTMPREQVVHRLNRRFGTRRTVPGVQQRARRHGLSTAYTAALTLTDLALIFPIHNRQVPRWVEAGLLRPERRGDGRKGSEWRFGIADVEAFVRANPHLFDWRAVRAGRWRDLVRAVTLRDPWLSAREAAARAGIGVATLHDRLAAGAVPGARRRGRHRTAPWRIPASALSAIGPARRSA